MPGWPAHAARRSFVGAGLLAVFGLLAAFALLALLIAGCSSSGTTEAPQPQPQPTFSAATQKSLAAAVDKVIVHDKLPGAVVSMGAPACPTPGASPSASF